ncbi:MAG TPA: F0F1 ATP synthase subunit C [Coriobacteriia bacterium]|nr:F0F1 ATP synthase subunit C [Coriobacteriia bacterium]
MIEKRLARWVFGSTFVLTMLVPAMALAEEAAAAPEEWQATVGKAMAAGLAMGLSALGAGYAQAKIGSAGAGTLAERPEVSIWIITLQALPEVIVLLGFVSAILISG